MISFLKCNSTECNFVELYKSKWNSKQVFISDKFLPEIHLKQPGFTHSARGPFSKNKESIQKFIETGDTSYIYKN